MSFDRIRAVADAVLLEGYVLYPYRASSTKNRYRWTFGVLAPRQWSEAGGCEPWWTETQVLLEPGDGTLVEGRLRFLQMERRCIEEATDASGTAFRPADSLEVDGELLLPWEEGKVQEIALGASIERAVRGEVIVPFELPGSETTTTVFRGSGETAGRVTRVRCALRGGIRLSAEPVRGERPLVRLQVRVENDTPWEDRTAVRAQAMRASCISTHLMLSVSNGAFVSLLDPPPWARGAAAGCNNVRAYPVLAGPAGQRDLVLSTPIILYDHPEVAPESPGDFFDATEIDELLALRTATLTEDEKRQARATDPRAAELIDRVEHLPREAVRRLHGAIRDRRPSPSTTSAVQPGTRVRLYPGARGTDAQDFLFAGRTATVAEVRQDVDGRQFLAVTLDDDPAAELHAWKGRFHYYRLDEVELLPQPSAGET